MSDQPPEDSSRGPRTLTGKVAHLITGIAVAASLYHLLTAGFGTPEAMIHRSLHILFLFPLIFLLYPFSKRSPRDRVQAMDLLGAAVSVLISVYIIWHHERIAWRFPYVDPVSLWDNVMAVLAILVTLEVTRRTVGWSLVILAFVFILYALLGAYLPGVLAIRGVSLTLLLEQLYLLPEGIFGTTTGVSSTFVYLFILFGAFLKFSRVGDFFVDAALSLFGKARGGPAKVAIFSSCLFGTMSGSAVANVFATGTFTIPLMMSIGYRPYFAAAVEAAASTGGQIMPPIMGSAAFIMSDFTGIPYLDICVAALVPALLFYFCLYLMLDFRAINRGLTGLQENKIPSFRKTMLWGSHLVAPVLVIIFLLAFRFSPTYAAFYAILSTIAVCMLRKHTRIGGTAFISALKTGATNALSVTACLVCAGIVVGITGLTGLGLKFTATIVYLAGGNLPLALVIISIVTLILGMGLPTPAAYLLVAIFGAPALVELGVSKMVAHLFCFYYAILSAITPPIAMAAYAGASIARCDFMKTSFSSISLGVTGFIVPYVFIFNPALILEGSSWPFIFFTIGSCTLGVFAISAAIQGWFWGKTDIFQRLVLIVASVLFLESWWPGLMKPLGVGLLVFLYLLKRKKSS
jgi:TRAP transporter 4TM/12TM fusion protein